MERERKGFFVKKSLPERYRSSVWDSGGSISRRRFIRDLSVGTAGLAVAAAFPGLVRSVVGAQMQLRKVVIVRHPGSFSDAGTFDQSVVAEMVNAAITEFTGQEAPGLAWSQIFPNLTANSKISIKVNCAHNACSSHPEVAYAIAEGLVSMRLNGSHLPRNNIIIWDRTTAELTDAGYIAYTGSDANRVRCYGIDTDPDEGFLVDIDGHMSSPSSIITEGCDGLVNLAVLKNHRASAITISKKGYLESTRGPSGNPLGHSDPERSDLKWVMKNGLRDKHRLSIIDSLVGMRSGESGGQPQISYGAIILGTDPAATDHVGREVSAGKGGTTPGDAGHIDTAGSVWPALETANPAEIELVEHNPIAPATREHVDRMIRFHKEGLATPLQVAWAINRYARGK
jgi:hypothetical protein